MIRDRGSYEICPICGWEDDGQDDPEYAPRYGAPRPADMVGGVNVDYALTEARENFARYLTMFRPTDRDFERERAAGQTKRKILAVYDRCVNGEVTFVEADAEAHGLLDEL